MKFEKEIWAYALKNALDYGKADAGKVMPKLFSHGLKKEDIGKVMPIIIEIVSKVNKLDKLEIADKFEDYKENVKEREEKEKTLPELPNVRGLVVTRLAPEPSKYLHIGHALSFVLNYVYAKRYNGKCVLRFEDANPEKVSKDYVDSILDDIKNYLEIEFESSKYVSDDMPIFYKYAEELINKDNAYMCFCEREKVRELRHAGKECECRKKIIEQNLKEWENFLGGKYKEGEATLRIKGDMKHKNHVMRDSVIFRFVKSKHFRQGNKYKVWPMYDFYNPIEDSLMGVTHILRSNEFEQRVILQDYIRDCLKLKKQTIVQYGRFNVIDANTKGREVREMVESGELIGWDDPRLVTLKALRRRGITREAIYQLVNELGLSKYQVNIDFKMIASVNRKILDRTANRYHFAKDPKKLKLINKLKIKEIEVKLHPEGDEIRKIKVGKEIFISKEDFEKFNGKEVRLMNLVNIIPGRESRVTDEENKKIQKIQWVSNGLKVKIFMPNGKWVKGIADEGIKRLKNSEIVQFERFGFVKLDKKKKEEYEFWFTHE